jgi:hypothetical protein
LEKVNIEGLLRAAGQNIKRLLKAGWRRKPHQLPGSAALRPAFHCHFPVDAILIFVSQPTFSTGCPLILVWQF